MSIERIRDLISSENHVISVYLKDLKKGKELVSVKIDEPMPSASIIKVMIMVEAFYQMKEGLYGEAERISVSKEDCVEYSLVSELTAKEFLFIDLVHMMITLSDNTATNRMIDLLGMENINQRAEKLGLKNLQLNRKMMDFEARKKGLENVMSLRDAVVLVEMIAKKELISDEACEKMLTIMKQQRDREMMRRYLPEELAAAHKTGELEGIHHDVGVLYPKQGPMVFGMFTKGIHPSVEGRRTIGEVARRLIMEESRNEDKRGVILSTTAPINLRPEKTSEMADEGIAGMVVEVKKRINEEWYLIKTDYDYEGFIHRDHLLLSEEIAEEWSKNAAHMIIGRSADVLEGPKYQRALVQLLVRGARVQITGKTEKDWVEIKLPDGKTGWVRESFIAKIPEREEHPKGREEELRRKVVETALSYQDTQYRWGGRTPLGIDCSGLTSISYLLNGITIYRDAIIKEEYVREITLEELNEGDLIYFPGHIAMYIGEGIYIHSRASANGVTFNSLNEQDDNYDHELKKQITGVATVF